MKSNKHSFGSGIDIESLRLSQHFSSEAEVEKLLTTVLVDKPNSQTFVRVHSDPQYQFDTAILKLKDDNQHFLVVPELWPELFNEIIPVTLFLGITRETDAFLWPARLPGEEGRMNEWHQSERKAIIEAMSHWIRIRSNRKLKGYDIVRANGALPEPVWPEKSMTQLIEIAFGDHVITDHNHPVLKNLRGEQ